MKQDPTRFGNPAEDLRAEKGCHPTFSLKAGNPPLIRFELSENQDFCKAFTVSSGKLPTEIPPLVEPDFAFFVYMVCNWPLEVEHLRERGVKAVKD